jgi:hypothetical protein
MTRGRPEARGGAFDCLGQPAVHCECGGECAQGGSVEAQALSTR